MTAYSIQVALARQTEDGGEASHAVEMPKQLIRDVDLSTLVTGFRGVNARPGLAWRPPIGCRRSARCVEVAGAPRTHRSERCGRPAREGAGCYGVCLLYTSRCV